MSKLIALVDGSVYSRSVCDHAAWIARRTGSSIEVLHVLGRREIASAPTDLSGSIALGARSALLAELSALDEQRAKLAQKRGRAILEDAKAVIEASGIAGVATKLRIGDIVETVVETEAEADMVVIGKRGEGADFAKLHLGSNLERIARSSRKPIFVASRAFKPIESFLIAFDGGASSLKAVDHVARSRLFEGLSCRLLMVEQDTPEAQKRLQDAVSILQAGGYPVKADIVAGQADTVIARTIEDEGINLLVMGAYGHSRIRSFVIGSTTTEMIRSCKVPVMLFR
ncbi:universal stress protein UspA [Mesorhizobium tianshanense]|uniref:Nucleotide-binding universal stress UspA family protein n=1 Tax=Mesorhizobium tianshanense TaxID=39844 RepID=A0A562NUI8_9HYPH|nr:universal stress protein [Mesorhizobium tianshanense]TWI35346.1 nucleotide-binding universal stress UspA family protein [Mesorhizobium tianshanense]GLS39253.1 universal stress protein UspA [Mesorhizobium tianshanense]